MKIEINIGTPFWEQEVLYVKIHIMHTWTTINKIFHPGVSVIFGYLYMLIK